ncbi:hypothetical protein SESBI_18459 [Sesbania bispinosa]|nr:hypothetical protein SESBI_18459 [Sesbania bispinosa]
MSMEEIRFRAECCVKGQKSNSNKRERLIEDRGVRRTSLSEEDFDRNRRDRKPVRFNPMGRGILGNIGRSDRSEGNGGGRAGARPSRDGVEEEEVRGTVTTIAGGFIGGGETSSGRKRYIRSVMKVSLVSSQEITHPHFPAITFSDLDFKGIKPHKHDPMVIKVRIVNYNVQQVLVDQGSSTDILYWSTFKKLVVSTLHLTMKFPLANEEIEVVKADQKAA